MTIEEFLSRVMPCSIKRGDDYHPAEILDRGGNNLTCDDGSIDALLAILNDAWSRHPREGERRCGTCRHWAQIRLRCNAALPEMVGVGYVSTANENHGKTCHVWQRKEETKP